MPRQVCQFEGCVREATPTGADDATHELALCTPHRTAVRHALHTDPDQVEVVGDAEGDGRPLRVVLRSMEA
jgi:hypothetical protein